MSDALMMMPAPVPVPLKGHVYLVQWKQDGTQCIEAFADRSAAVAYANHIGLHAYVACVAVRTPEYVTHVFGIAASPEPVPVPPGWMPIESAPKDGRKIILTYRNANDKPRTVMAAWVTDEEAAETDEDGVGLEAGWYESIDNWDDYSQVAIHAGEPTHWMPLPPPPGIAAFPEVPNV